MNAGPARQQTADAPEPVAAATFGPNEVIEHAEKTGSYGGTCTCPDGTAYQVADNADYCGSLACVGGMAGPCNAQVGEWANRRVVCGQQEGGGPYIRENEVLEDVPGVGFWGCVCTCPDGRSTRSAIRAIVRRARDRD
eukprot:2156036-Prymnesium_polylepis.1